MNNENGVCTLHSLFGLTFGRTRSVDVGGGVSRSEDHVKKTRKTKSIDGEWSLEILGLLQKGKVNPSQSVLGDEISSF